MARPAAFAASVPLALPLVAENGGLFVSQGVAATHPDRVIRSHELIFVRSGRLSMAEEGESFDVDAGQTLVLRPGRRHYGAAPYPPDLSFYWVHFRLAPGSAPARGRRLAAALPLPRHATPARPDRLAELFHRFIDDQESGRLTPISAALLILLMLDELGQTGSGASTSGELLAARVEAWVGANLRRAITASDVAEALSLNPDYVNRAFRRARGQTVTEFIHRRRIREARALLRETTLSLKQIAHRCGFNDPAYLRRLFRRYEGVTPMRFRRLYGRLHINVR